MRQILVVILVVLTVLLLLRPNMSYYSASELYKDISGGAVLAGPFTGLLQESTNDMMKEPYSDKDGYAEYSENLRIYPYDKEDEIVSSVKTTTCTNPKDCPNTLVQNMSEYKDISDATLILKSGQTVSVKDLLM